MYGIWSERVDDLVTVPPHFAGRGQQIFLGDVSSRRLSFTRDRVRLRQWAADAAMAQLRLVILDQS